MTVQDFIELLEENKNERGVEHWARLNHSGMKSYGMGLGQVKKLAKGVKKNHDLALELWDNSIYELKILSGLLDEPKKVTREQVDNQMTDAGFWLLSHSLVGNLLHKLPYAPNLAEDYRESDNHNLRRVAFLLVYHLAKNMKLPDDYFHPFLDQIDATINEEENFVKDAMNGCLLTLGQRNANMHARSLEVVRNYGTLTIDYGDTACEVVDIAKHLNSDRILSKINS
jgi:3-methyladenine DNA glycosylase AlkD